MTPGSAAWDEFFGHYPVLFKNGADIVKINPNNFGQDINGNTIDITSGSAGDVMIAFPRHGLRMSKSGDIVTVSMTDNPNNPDFKYYAHSRGSTLKDKLYIGAYMGSEIDGKLRSLSGKLPSNNKSIVEFRTLARTNTPASNGNGGSGYDQMSFYPLTYLQAMYVLKYKNLNSQEVIGTGYNNPEPSDNSTKHTGETETWGMDKENGEVTNSTKHVKLFGIEDMWGNIHEWIDGIYCLLQCEYTTTQNFNDETIYINQGETHVTSQVWSHIKEIIGTSELGFCLDKGAGSSSTYYCDWGTIPPNSPTKYWMAYGSNVSNSNVGIFFWNQQYTSDQSRASFSSRLVYL